MSDSTPPLSSADRARAHALSRMRWVATGLLVLAAVIYVVTRHHESGWGGFLGYVHAGAEASMVGAIADWFAVTALFRHPLGLPIPHTAIIPRRKDDLGRGLQEFVTTNFLREDIIRERLATADVSRKVGEWIASAATVDRLIDDLLVGLRTWLVDHPEAFLTSVDGRLPTWIPAGIRSVVTDKLHDELVGFITTVRQDQGHPLRIELRLYGERLAHDRDRQERLDKVVADAVVVLVEKYGADIVSIISHTIEQWDGKAAAQRIELYAGRDLQFIRINGTVVGCLVGVVIFALTQVLS